MHVLHGKPHIEGFVGEFTKCGMKQVEVPWGPQPLSVHRLALATLPPCPGVATLPPCPGVFQLTCSMLRFLYSEGLLSRAQEDAHTCAACVKTEFRPQKSHECWVGIASSLSFQSVGDRSRRSWEQASQIDELNHGALGSSERPYPNT